MTTLERLTSFTRRVLKILMNDSVFLDASLVL